MIGASRHTVTSRDAASGRVWCGHTDPSNFIRGANVVGPSWRYGTTANRAYRSGRLELRLPATFYGSLTRIAALSAAGFTFPRETLDDVGVVQTTSRAITNRSE